MSIYIYQQMEPINYDIYKDKGLTGLVNLGNTCFMNSCLQCISHTYPLCELLNNGEFIKNKLNHMGDGILLKEWADLNKLMWSENCVISCDRWVECVQKAAVKQGQHLFTGFDQNDCAEFLMFILDNFHESLKREVKMSINGIPLNNRDKMAIICYNKIKEMYEKEYSELINIFYGVQITRIRSSTDINKVYVEKPEPFFIINAAIPENEGSGNTFTIKQCFELSLSKEILDGDNAWYNEETKQKESVYIEHSYWNLPNIMILCLKRFNNYGRKIHKLLSIDEEKYEGTNYSLFTDLSKYVESHDAEQYKYEVYGICVHSGGSALGGHYVSVVKNANNNWYLYNDQSVTKIDEPHKHVQQLYARSYCLFLKKTNI
jgi:ubiquitin C-terminal hydrolase